jgi:ABC-type glycerol-3-phosphate transport system permease component
VAAIAHSSPANRKTIGGRLGRILLWAWLLLSLVPLLFILVTSIKPSGQARTIPPAWLFRPTFEHYGSVLSGGQGTSVGFSRLLFNSIAVTLGSTILTVALAVPAAYALTLREFRQRKFLSSWILSTYMFPPIVAVIPIFILAGKLGIIDTYPVLIIPYAAFNLPIAVWILRSSILQLPYEIQEAAVVDGAGRWAILRHIIWPLLIPAVATAAILTAILSWNEFLFALSLTRAAAKTSPVGVQEFTGMFGTDWGKLTAASSLIIAPIVVMTLVLRKRIVSGLTFGAVK